MNTPCLAEDEALQQRHPPSQAHTTAGPTETAPAQTRGKVFDVDCELSYQLNGNCDFLFQIHAFDGLQQKLLSESLEINPPTPFHVYEDPSIGHRFMRLQAGAGPFSVRYRAQVERFADAPAQDAQEMSIAELPDEVLHNLMPTRYCESDLMGRAAIKMFGQLPPGFSRVQAICDWIYTHVDYQIGTSDATTTARDVFLRRAGVCRDFAHLGITFCRALNIPARLVVGYARFEDPPPDFHAVFEAYLGGRWVVFDPTRMSPTEELIRIAMGRDAKDVAFATIFGPACMSSMAPNLSADD